jgi:hypothetical protein
MSSANEVFKGTACCRDTAKTYYYLAGEDASAKPHGTSCSLISKLLRYQSLHYPTASIVDQRRSWDHRRHAHASSFKISLYIPSPEWHQKLKSEQSTNPLHPPRCIMAYLLLLPSPAVALGPVLLELLLLELSGQMAWQL